MTVLPRCYHGPIVQMCHCMGVSPKWRPPPENAPMGEFLFLFVLATQTCNSALGAFTGIAGNKNCFLTNSNGFKYHVCIS